MAGGLGVMPSFLCTMSEVTLWDRLAASGVRRCPWCRLDDLELRGPTIEKSIADNPLHLACRGCAAVTVLDIGRLERLLS